MEFLITLALLLLIGSLLASPLGVFLPARSGTREGGFHEVFISYSLWRSEIDR